MFAGRPPAAVATNLVRRRFGECAQTGPEGVEKLAPRFVLPARVAEWQTRPV